MVIVQNRQSKEYRIFKNVKAILRYINADRSQDFTPYTTKDWKEGLEEFTDYTLLKAEK